MNEKHAYIFDLDGTIYNGADPITGALETVEALRKRGHRVFFCSNNSSRTRAAVCDNLNRMGFATSVDFVYTATNAAAQYLSDYAMSTVAVVGMQGLREEITGNGIKIKSTGDPDVDALVIGIDTEFTYRKLASIVPYKDSQVKIIGLNRDLLFPSDGGVILPGCGSIVNCIEGTLGRRADLIIGKPQPLLAKLIMKDHGMAPEHLVFVGDSVESDIGIARRIGAQGILICPDSPGDSFSNDIARIRSILELVQ